MFNFFRRWRRSRMGKCLFCEHEAPLRDFSKEYREEHGTSFSSGVKRDMDKGPKGSGQKDSGQKGSGQKGSGQKGSSRRGSGAPKRKPTPKPKATSAYEEMGTQGLSNYDEMGTKGFSKVTPKKKRPAPKLDVYEEMGTQGLSNYDEMGTKGFSKVTPKKKRPAPKSRRRTQVDTYDEMGTKGYVDWADYRGSKGYRRKGSGPKGA